MATASMVLGIIALLIAVFGCGVGSWVGSVCGILAIIFGAVAKKKNDEGKGMANAGLVMGIIALCWGLIMTAACVACIVLSVGTTEVFLENSGLMQEFIEAFENLSI